MSVYIVTDDTQPAPPSALGADAEPDTSRPPSSLEKKSGETDAATAATIPTQEVFLTSTATLEDAALSARQLIDDLEAENAKKEQEEQAIYAPWDATDHTPNAPDPNRLIALLCFSGRTGEGGTNPARGPPEQAGVHEQPAGRAPQGG